jgi:hypothetical protein
MSIKVMILGKYKIRLGLILFLFMPLMVEANTTDFSQSSCTVIYSLKRSADQYFNNEVAILQNQLIRQNVQLIDLNQWRSAPPHLQISGRQRNQIRATYQLSNTANQAVVISPKGKVISRYTGSVTLVNALLDCSV